MCYNESIKAILVVGWACIVIAGEIIGLLYLPPKIRPQVTVDYEV
jgi:hypothetical protein